MTYRRPLSLAPALTHYINSRVGAQILLVPLRESNQLRRRAYDLSL